MVDRSQDPRLNELFSNVCEVVSGLEDETERVRWLSQTVAHRLGGAMGSESAARWRQSSRVLKAEHKSVVIPVGELDCGLVRHRALLFKVLAEAAGIPVHQHAFSLTDVYAAAEAFVTGTFGGLTPVHTIDGRTIGTGEQGPMTIRLLSLIHI